jgi:hypothetical protein
MKRTVVIALALSSTLGLAACGNTTGDRALSGGALGAGAGAVGGALMGEPLAGAAIGGAAGAATGALTNSDQINLGKPAWR